MHTEAGTAAFQNKKRRFKATFGAASLCIFGAATAALAWGSTEEAVGLGAAQGDNPVQTESPNASSDLQASTSSDQQSSGTLQEVVVTAEKRTEDLQLVPASITALSGTALQNNGVTDFHGYANFVPNLSFAGGYGPDSDTIAIRGINGGNGSTGMYLDDTPLPSGLDPRVFDLSRIEVLRGPQGTLYGARSMGGVVRLITNQPDPRGTEFDFDSVVSDTHGGGVNDSFEALANLPLGEHAAVRISGFDDHESGFLNRESYGWPANPPTLPAELAPYAPPGGLTPFRETNVNTEEQRGGAIAFVLKLFDDHLTITPRVLVQQTQYSNEPIADYSASNPILYRSFNIEEPSISTFHLYTLTAKYHFSAGDITWASSLYKQADFAVSDFSEVIVFPQNFVYAPYVIPSVANTGGHANDLVQELRFASTFSGPFQTVVGFYYEKDNNHTGYAPIVIPGFLANLYSDQGQTVQTEKAVYAQATYALTKRLDLIAGLRDFQDNGTNTDVQEGYVGNPTPFAGQQSGRGITPKYGVRFALNDDVNLFADAAKGYRFGGNNVEYEFCDSDYLAQGITPAQGETYRSDAVWSYEAGTKTTWMDRRLTVDATAFHINWTGIQQSIEFACDATLTVNAGKAESNGAELEIAAAPAAGLRLQAGAGYTAAHIVNGGQFSGGALSAGQPIEQVPLWNGSMQLDYDFTISSLPSFFHIDYSYTGRSISTATSSTPLERDPYALVNSRFGVKFHALQVALFVDNATNERANLSDVFGTGFVFPGRDRFRVNRPRTVGLDINIQF